MYEEGSSEDEGEVIEHYLAKLFHFRDELADEERFYRVTHSFLAILISKYNNLYHCNLSDNFQGREELVRIQCMNEVFKSLQLSSCDDIEIIGDALRFIKTTLDQIKSLLTSTFSNLKVLSDELDYVDSSDTVFSEELGDRIDRLVLEYNESIERHYEKIIISEEEANVGPSQMMLFHEVDEGIRANNSIKLIFDKLALVLDVADFSSYEVEFFAVRPDAIRQRPRP